MEENGIQNGGAPTADGGQDRLGWKTELPESQRSHEAFAAYATKSDLFKGHLDLYTQNKEASQKISDYEGKLANAIFMPGDNATAEETEAFYRKIGKPEKAGEYEFPKTEGIEHDPRFVEWAQGTFHQANLTKEQAGLIGKSWDQFVGAMNKASQEAAEKAKSDTEAAVKAELGEQYAEASELTRRLLSKHAKPEEIASLEESGTGNNPVVIRLLYHFAKLTGEDKSPQGGKPTGNEQPNAYGFIYDKSPVPPNRQ